ncbi:peptide/nickel transport system substrate-binding protein [Frondihabitans sp. PhB188]|uniref:ABC transporter substrate-binding protein n=1 Tax=Frondihabitans sp. PhB188 TaxID=2485200 RepID=UPI000F4666A8|nr:ABC transporter substrate-binding protein [Frondihabitans sp. PhB188]ROQ39972.1 peptide/nickel transport system substrate-binding protein [Frondihabitans sp. PhB188]
MHTTPRTRTRRAAAALGSLLAAALVLTGCSIDIKSAPDPSLGADTMLIAADNGSPSLQRVFNPYLPNTRVASWYMFEPLVILNDLNGDEEPWLASKTEIPDPQTVVFTIRQGVKWSDGKAFGPDDVKFTFDMLKKFPSLDLKGAWQYMKSVEVKGDTVVVHLKGDDVPAAQIIEQTQIVPEHIWSKVKDPSTFTNPDPVGTGPYNLGNFTPQEYAMDKNPLYWQADKVKVQHLVLPASNTQLDVVTKGYDWAFSFISDVKGTWNAANPSNTYWFPPGGTISLFPNLTEAPFNDLDFRKGLSYALDRKAVGDAAAEGYMQQAGQTGMLLPNQEDLLDPAIPDKGLIAQSDSQAKSSFAKAGYTMKDGKLVDTTGKALTITITTANGYSDWLRAVQAITKQWAAVGITVKVAQPQPAAYQLALRNGDFQLAMGSVGGTGSVYQDFANNLSSEFYTPIGNQAANNFGRYRSAEVDAILNEFTTTTDEQEQKQLGYRLQQIYYDELPSIGLYYGGSWGLFSTQKFTGWPSADDPYTSPKTYVSTALLILTHLKKSEAAK